MSSAARTTPLTAAICEAMSRPEMRFVPVKSEEQQATLMLHKTRELLIKQRTMGINSLRGHLSDFGIVAAKGLGRVDELLEKAESDATLPEIAKAALTILVQHLEAIEASIAVLDQEIAAVHTQSPVSRLLASIPGIGKITASAIVASVPDPSIFKSGRDFSAWLGMTPRQNSSGGKEKLGSITKRGNRYLRRCSCWARPRCCAWLAGGKAPCAIGWSRFSRANPRDWSRWRSPTSSRGSYGPL